MKKIIAFLFLSVLITVNVFGQTNAEYAAALKKMFVVTGSNETYKATIKQMFAMYKAESTLNPEKLKVLEDEMLKTSLNELTDMLVPVYKKYMTINDIEEIVKFYESPTGKKYARNSPAITQEALKIGQQWGKKFAEQLQSSLKK